MLSDQDIEILLNKEIVIYPYRPEKDLTPVGYNLNPSDFVFSITHKCLIKTTYNLEGNKVFKIKRHDIVLILTQEAVWVSQKIGGTFHSKVGVVSLGFGHISTTLDPGWAGPLLISLNNPTDIELELPAEKSFVTLIFYKVRKPALRNHDNSPSRVDLIEPISKQVSINRSNNKSKYFNFTNTKDAQLEQNQAQFIVASHKIIADPLAYNEFKEKFKELSKNSNRYILKRLKINAKKDFLNSIFFWILTVFEVILCLVLLLKLISGLFLLVYPFNLTINLIDTNGFFAIIAILISCLQLTINMKQK
ncbi:dCTP deaminase domain-containing protein [Nostoc sp.]|uniref:dCTP deaminase domain-containing protein n=1 Tax=Nostoc sp. TaxID=1180 RepID=UPI002FF97137